MGVNKMLVLNCQKMLEINCHFLLESTCRLQMSRIENLGSYNDVRILLQKYGGDKEKLFQAIGDATVAKESPKLLTKGGFIGGAVVLVGGGLIWAVH